MPFKSILRAIEHIINYHIKSYTDTSKTLLKRKKMPVDNLVICNNL
jgi:hypothetical protein